MKKDKLEEEIENYGLEEHQKIALYNFIKHKLLSQRKEDIEMFEKILKECKVKFDEFGVDYCIVDEIEQKLKDLK